MFPSLNLLEPFRRANLGLFAGKTKQYGNNVPFSKHKTRRTWLPNVQRKRLDSEVLGQKVRLKVTTRALRTIKKKGGLDNYLKDTPAHKLGYTGLGLKLKIQDEEARRTGEYERSPEAKAERAARMSSHSKFGLALAAIHTTIKRAQNSIPGGTLEEARKARIKAAKALGRTGLATPEETFQYLTQPRL